MTIVSFRFFLFTAGLVAVYYLVPKKYRWITLLAASYLFYWLNSRWLAAVLFAATMVTYFTGRLIQRQADREQGWIAQHGTELGKEEKKRRKDVLKKRTKRILLLGVAVDLGLLLFLKYFNFFGENINSLLNRLGAGNPIPTLNLLLPLGISFWTLQAVAYMTDVYRGKVKADRNPVKFMLFMSFFPQIVQGPIPRYKQLANQLYEGHAFDYENLRSGAQLMLWGVMKKLVIAERIAVPVNEIFTNYTQYSGLIVLMASMLYGLQLYADFSGGMDIVRGVAKMVGIDLELNFRQPYFSTSIEDFWRRWHITLGSWMKDYVFYPLSLSKAFGSLGRKSRKVLGQYIGKRLPAFLAMFVVYFLVGFWHGAEWRYILYGLWNGLFIMVSILLEGVYQKTREKLHLEETAVTWRAFRMIRTFIIVCFGRFFSRAASVEAALGMFGRVFQGWRNLTFITNGKLLTLGLNNANWIAMMIGILLLFFVDVKHEKGVRFRQSIARQPLPFRWAIYIIAVAAVLIFGYYGPAYDAASFIYEKF